MGLDVMHRGPFSADDRIERSKLTQEELADSGRGQPLGPPTESLAIIESWVSTDGNAVADRQRHSRSHALRVARVRSARDVGGGHQRKQRLIGFRISFADVSVQIELLYQALDRSKDAAWSSDESLPASKMLQRSAIDPMMVHTAAAVDADRNLRPCPRRATL